MINLLPPTAKKEIRAARSNLLLVRYVILLACVVVLLIGAMGVTYMFLDTSATRARALREDNEAQTAGFAETQAEAEELRRELEAARQLFDEEVRYSLALTRISNLLPDGTALEQLELSPSSFGEPETFSVLITGRTAAYALQNSFLNSDYMSSVTLGRLEVNNDNPQYPYTLEITATIDRSIAR